jgi:hypothetical protein
MSKQPSRARRAAKPVRASPLISMYVPSLQPGAHASRQLLVSKTVVGVTLNRYRDSCEIVYSDGRKVTAAGMWGLLFKMLRGASK